MLYMIKCGSFCLFIRILAKVPTVSALSVKISLKQSSQFCDVLNLKSIKEAW